jgi:hypothetical protein
MKITEKVEQIHQFVSTPAGAGKGILMQQQASEAIKGGMNSPAWRTFMCNFASNPTQLQRLLGQDGLVGKPWGTIALAYLPANAMCGTGTTTDTLGPMPQPFRDALDDSLPIDEIQTDCQNQIDNLDVSEFI